MSLLTHIKRCPDPITKNHASMLLRPCIDATWPKTHSRDAYRHQSHDPNTARFILRPHPHSKVAKTETYFEGPDIRRHHPAYILAPSTSTLPSRMYRNPSLCMRSSLKNPSSIMAFCFWSEKVSPFMRIYSCYPRILPTIRLFSMYTRIHSSMFIFSELTCIYTHMHGRLFRQTC
jgi:hypothetical protein